MNFARALCAPGSATIIFAGASFMQSALPASGGAEAARSAGVALPSSSVSSVFHIAKSENRNQVHYAVRVDARCRPVGRAPVHGYWRDLEDGPNAVSPLLDHEQPAYGLTAPAAIALNEDGGEIRIGMRGFPDRLLRVVTWKQGGSCRARVFTQIRKQPAVLRSIYVELGPLLRVDYALVRGVRVADGRDVEEKVDG